MARRALRRTFRPSAYTRGVSEGTYPGGHEGEYGFIVPIWAGLKLKEALFGDDGEEEPPSVAGTFMDYWWVALVAVPVLYVGINKALDRGEKR